MVVHSRCHSLVELLGVIRRHYMVEINTDGKGLKKNRRNFRFHCHVHRKLSMFLSGSGEKYPIGSQRTSQTVVIFLV